MTKYSTMFLDHQLKTETSLTPQMASALSSATANSISSHTKLRSVAGFRIHRYSQFHQFSSDGPKHGRCLIFKATDDKGGDKRPKARSVICTDCDGNGAVLCSQCKGVGVNQEEFFNGQFKVGDACWLCGGRKEMLCGNCNGAGFLGGFMSTFDQ